MGNHENHGQPERDPHAADRPIGNRPAQNARISTPGGVVDGLTRGAGDAADFLGLNQELGAAPAAQPAPVAAPIAAPSAATEPAPDTGASWLFQTPEPEPVVVAGTEPEPDEGVAERVEEIEYQEPETRSHRMRPALLVAGAAAIVGMIGFATWSAFRASHSGAELGVPSVVDASAVPQPPRLAEPAPSAASRYPGRRALVPGERTPAVGDDSVASLASAAPVSETFAGAEEPETESMDLAFQETPPPTQWLEAASEETFFPEEPSSREPIVEETDTYEEEPPVGDWGVGAVEGEPAGGATAPSAAVDPDEFSFPEPQASSEVPSAETADLPSDATSLIPAEPAPATEAAEYARPGSDEGIAAADEIRATELDPLPRIAEPRETDAALRPSQVVSAPEATDVETSAAPVADAAGAAATIAAEPVGSLEVGGAPTIPVAPPDGAGTPATTSPASTSPVVQSIARRSVAPWVAEPMPWRRIDGWQAPTPSVDGTTASVTFPAASSAPNAVAAPSPAPAPAGAEVAGTAPASSDASPASTAPMGTLGGVPASVAAQPTVAPQVASADPGADPPVVLGGAPKPTAPKAASVVELGGLRRASAADLAGIWTESSIPFDAISGPDRILTPSVGRVRVHLVEKQILEGMLYSVGQNQITLSTDLGRIGVAADRVQKIDCVDVAKADPSKQESAQMRIKTPGGIVLGKIVSTEGDRTVVQTKDGSRVTFASKDIEVQPDAKIGIKP